jgi:hypothetical protein
MVFRIGKSVILAIIMYFSLRFLGISSGASFIVSLIPSVLGSLDVMTGKVYALTGLVFIIACGSALAPDLKMPFNHFVNYCVSHTK